MKIRLRTNSSGGTVWMLDLGVVDGKRIRRAFKTKKAAEDEAAAMMRLRARHGAMGVRLSGGELAVAVAAMERLEAVGATISEAVEYFLKRGARIRRRVTVADGVREFLKDQAAAGKSLRSIQTWRGTLMPFAALVGTRAMHEVTGDDVRGWLFGQGWAPRTIKGHLGNVRTFFAWARRQGMVGEIPGEELRAPRVVVGQIGTLMVDECGRLLEAAAKGKRRLLPYVVLGLFCGLRRAELERLHWSAVNIEEGMVTVDAELAKTRSRRVVDIPANALAWLGLVKRKPGDRVTPWELKELLVELRAAAKIAVWPNNALRHTFASMHYAQHQNENLLAAQMGNSPRMVHQHYRALRTRAEAVRFWELRP